MKTDEASTSMLYDTLQHRESYTVHVTALLPFNGQWLGLVAAREDSNRRDEDFGFEVPRFLLRHHGSHIANAAHGAATFVSDQPAAKLILSRSAQAER